MTRPRGKGLVLALVALALIVLTGQRSVTEVAAQATPTPPALSYRANIAPNRQYRRFPQLFRDCR